MAVAPEITEGTVFFSALAANLMQAADAFAKARSSGKRPDIHEFLRYLHDQQKQDLAEIINGNLKVAQMVSALLNSGEQLEARLLMMDKALATLAQAVPTLAGLAEVAHPGSALSEQALGLLRGLAEVPGRSLFIVEMMSEGWNVSDGAGGTYEVPEPHHLIDDVHDLLDRRLIRSRDNTSRDFQITREGARFVRLLTSAE